MGTLKTALIGTLVTILFSFSIFGLVGSFSQANNVPINSSIATEYNAIAGATGSFTNPSNAGVFNGLANEESAINSTANANPTGLCSITILSTACAFTNALGNAWTVLWALPGLFIGVLQFVASPFIAVGIPTDFALGIAVAIFVALGALVIVSIITLTPN